MKFFAQKYITTESKANPKTIALRLDRALRTFNRVYHTQFKVVLVKLDRQNDYCVNSFSWAVQYNLNACETHGWVSLPKTGLLYCFYLITILLLFGTVDKSIPSIGEAMGWPFP